MVHVVRTPDRVVEACWTSFALAQAVQGLREQVAAFAEAHGVGGEPLGDLRLATSEALSNAVIHAYTDRPAPGSVTARIAIDGSGGQVSVSDRGIGMRARRDSPGAGLGLSIIAAVSDDVSIGTGPDASGTTITFSSARWCAVGRPPHETRVSAAVACSVCGHDVALAPEVSACPPETSRDPVCPSCQRRRQLVVNERTLDQATRAARSRASGRR